MKNLFEELDKVYKLIDEAKDYAKIDLLGEVKCQSFLLPIHSFEFGSKDPKAPCFGLFGGVHGLEKIGTELAVYFLYNLCERLAWDKSLQDLLTKVRIVSIPLINPGGMYLDQRSNPNGVDLMRNAPINAKGKTLPFASGHRVGNYLPWYRGQENQLEFENQLLQNFVETKMHSSDFSLALDLHSGFGMKDRLWFPYSKTKDAFPYYDVAVKMKSMIDESLKHHIYTIEPQSNSYLIHGDIWDHLFDSHYAQDQKDGRIFIPWTLEMGSWLWVRKNPLQVLNSSGLFNPFKRHRFKRVMRRHWRLLDLFLHLCASHKGWLNENYRITQGLR